MEKTNKFKFGKLIFLCVVIIIPIIAAGFICSYSYKRYEDQYFSAYWDKTLKDNEEDTKGQIESYLRYVTYAYTLCHTEQIKVNDKKAFDLNVYRTIYNTITKDEDGKNVNNFSVVYYFIMFNIDYKVVNDFKNSGLDEADQKELTADALPDIYFNIYDQDTIGNKNSADSVTFESIANPVIYDYGYAPLFDETSKKTELEDYAYMKWVECSPASFNHYDTYSNQVNIRLHEDSSAASSASSTIKKNMIYGANKENEYNTLNYNDFYTNVEDLAEYDSETGTFANYVVGYNQDIIAAGYKNYVWSTYIWWQALVAFVLIGAVTISFFFVFYLEGDKENKNTKMVESSQKKSVTPKKTKKK